MSKTLIIAEKPSVARHLGRVLGATQLGEGFLEGPELIVGSAVGHLIQLKSFASYGSPYDSWNIPWEQLPLIPAPFGKEVIPGREKPFQVLVRLLKRADVTRVVNACDAAREGELIFDLIMEQAGCRKPVFRLWLNDETEAGIKRAWGALKPASAYDNLRRAAHARSEADWLVGLNGSVALRQAAQAAGHRGKFSCGRVQSAVLRLVVERDKAIAEFVPTPFWVVRAAFETSQKQRYEGLYINPAQKEHPQRILQLAEAQRILAQAQGPGHLLQVEKSRVAEPPPQLYDLSNLQKEANRLYGFTAQQTLDLAQELYQAPMSLISYPRTDSRYLTQAVAARLPLILGQMAVPPYQAWAQQALHSPTLNALGKRFVDDAKAPEHYALIPTEKGLDSAVAAKLTGPQKNLYDLIARRFLAMFFPPSLFDKLQALTQVAGSQGGHFLFQTQGRTLLEPGWRVVYQDQEKGDENRGAEKGSKKVASASASQDKPREDESIPLPILVQGTNVANRGLKSEQQMTKPPPYYTEATLLQAMERAGSSVTDEAARAAMKLCGLGRPATRAGMIEKLVNIEALARQGGKGAKVTLRATPKGSLIDSLLPRDVPLGEPLMTGQWEHKLEQMAAGKFSPQVFHNELLALTRKVVESFSHTRMPPAAALPPPADALPCPAGAERHPQQAGYLLERQNNTTKTKFVVCHQPECKYSSDAPKNKAEKKGLAENRCPVCGSAVRLKRSEKGDWWPCAQRECRGVWRPGGNGGPGPGTQGQALRPARRIRD